MAPGERFTLQIFADTKSAESALKSFAAKQKALAKELAASTPAQAKGLIAPRVGPAFAQGGQLSAQLAGSVKAGTLTQGQADALKAKYLKSSNDLVRAQLRETAGLNATAASRVQSAAHLEGFKRAQAALNATLKANASAQSEQAVVTKQSTAKQKAASDQKVRATLFPPITRDPTGKVRQPYVPGAIPLSAAYETPDQRAVRLGQAREQSRLASAGDPKTQQLRSETARLRALEKTGIAKSVALDTQVQAAKFETIRAQGIANKGIRARVATDPAHIAADANLRIAKDQATATTKARIASDIRTITKERVAASQATPFQRVYGRTTGQDVGAAPTGGQFFGRKLATTAGYAGSSIALFAAVGGIAKSVKEAEELDKVMNDIGFQLDSFRERGLNVPGTSEVRKEIMGIARETGLAADEVGRVAFQLQGAFGGDVVRAMRETAAAAEFVRLTGQSLEETIDHFTALSQSFEDGELSAREFGDSAFGLQERFGVLAPEILNFAADLAPVAEAAGFTVQELQALGAAAQKFSGRSGTALAEAFGRIIPQVQGRATEFIGLFQQTPDLRPLADDLAAAFGSGDIQEVFSILIGSYDKLSRTQKNYVIDLLGGRREAASLIGVLENGDEVLTEWAGTYDDTGKQAEKFAVRQETLTQQLARFGEQLSQLGIKIFESGFRDLLEFILSSGSGVVSVLAGLTSAFSALNGAIPGGPGSAFEGLPGKILAVVAALKLLQAAGNTALAGRLFARSGAARLGAVPGGASALFASPVTRLNQLTAAQQAAQTQAGPFRTLSGRAPIGVPPTAVPRIGIRDSYAQQGMRGTARAFWQNTSEGLRRSVGDNRGMIGAAGLLIGTQIISQITSSAVEAARERGREQVSGIGDRLAEGRFVSEGEQARLSELANSGVNNGFQNFGMRFGTNLQNNLPVIGDALGGIFLSQSQDEIEFQAAATEARAIMNAQVADDLQAQVDALRTAGLLGIDEAIQIIADNESLPVEEIQRIVDKAARGEGLSPSEQQIYTALQETIPRAIRKNAEVAALLLPTQDERNFADVAATLDSVTQRYEAGAASRGEYVNALARAAAGARALIASGSTDEEALAGAYEDLQTFRQELSTGLLAEIEMAEKFRGFSGVSQSSSLEARSSDLLAALRSGLLTPEDRTSALEQYLQVQQEMIEAEAEAAGSLAEANQIRRRGRAVPNDIRAQILSEQIGADTEYQRFLDEIPAGLNEVLGGFDKFNDDTTALMVAYGLSLQEARLAVLDNLIEFYESRLYTTDSGRRRGRPEGAANGILNALRGERRRTANADLSGVNTQDVDRVQNDSEQAAEDEENAAQEMADARFALLESLTEDPVELAEIAVARAQAALSRAKGPAEVKAAQAELNLAQRGLRDAIRDVYDSQFELLESTTEDPVKLAKFALQRALEDLRRARQAGDDAAINRALAAVNNARRGVRNVLQEVMDAQTGLLIAIADAAGNTVRSAQLALQQAQRELRRLRDQDAGGAAIRNARARVVSTQAGVRDALLSRRQDHYQFLHDMGRITTGQLVSYLQSLLSIPDLTRQQIRDIQLQIRNLRQELGQDFQFNLPTELALPTLFEVRRADQSGGRNFTDQRQVTVNVNVSSNVDLAALESTLASSIGANVNGNIPRRY